MVRSDIEREYTEKTRRYSDIVSINKQFKNSVNIEYDLNSYHKLSEYIPTDDICEVMQYFLMQLKLIKIIEQIYWWVLMVKENHI